MPLIHEQDVLKGLLVQEAMRRQVISLPQEASLAQAIRAMIKYKVNAVLVTETAGEGVGVVSKTDLMGAYYAGLPIEITVATIMMGPPQFCHWQDSLDAALDTMRSQKIHRLYVTCEAPRKALGVLAYPDIVGLLYRFCNKCEKSILKRGATTSDQVLTDRYKMREVMTPAIYAHSVADSLQTVMEGLAAQRFGATLIRDQEGMPVGVVSKTDLTKAYLHGVSAETAAGAIMTSPVQSCDQEELLVTALKQMIFADVHRIFVFKEEPKNLVGVFSLSDAARIRSGTCRACITSRLKL
jgi:CBS domain-containing protein